jgi:hypothetical protein
MIVCYIARSNVILKQTVHSKLDAKFTWFLKFEIRIVRLFCYKYYHACEYNWSEMHFG